MGTSGDNPDSPKGDRYSLHGMSPEDAIRRMFESKPMPRKPFCLACGELDDNVGMINAYGEFCCPKCGLPLNSRMS